MPGRAFRFGFVARTLAPGETWADKARRAEQLGYSILTMPDHFRNQLAPVPALTAAALATARLRVGSLVFAVDFHHPAVLAREVAAMDQLSGGRFELGLGAGWLRSEYEEAGIPYDAAGRRIERLAEAVAIIKGLLGGERVTFVGRHYTITSLEGRPGVQRPRPPILIGGGGRRTLTLAAREADIVGFVPRARQDGGGLEWDDFGAAALLEKLAWVREAAGARFAALELNTLIQAAVVTDDAATAADRDAVSCHAGAGARMPVRAGGDGGGDLRNHPATSGSLRDLLPVDLRAGCGGVRAGGGETQRAMTRR
jgi:probable F420-dependent oxidoreductase